MSDNKIMVTRSSMPPYEEYIEAIKPLWESHWLTNKGVYHNELEERLKRYLDVPMLSLMVNGHMALELIIQAFDFPKGAEVITTPFTFVSTTHAIVRNGLIPVFCDVKEEDGTIDESKIEQLITEKTVAIMPVHVYGNVCNVDEIQRIAEKYGLKVIYDAAHAFGVKYRGRGIGNYGDASVFSFHATKVFNTIEGGAVAFADEKIAEKLGLLRNFGVCGEERVVLTGTNAKMNEFAAIMGLCNLNHIEEAFAARAAVWEIYKNNLQRTRGLRTFTENDAVEKNFSYFPILVDEDFGMTRDELYNHLRSKGIYARKYFFPLTSEQESLAGTQWRRETKIARDLANRVLVLPLYEGLEDQEVYRVLEAIGSR